MYLRWLIYLLYICMCAYIHICALAVCLSTLIHLQNALPLLRRRWPRCLWVAFYGFPIFFSPFYTHTNRVSFLIVLICFPYVDLYIARLFITISWCLLFPNMRWASETHTQTHMHIFYLIYTHTYRQHFENLEGGKRMRNRCNLLHYTCNTRVQHCFCYYMLALLCL